MAGAQTNEDRDLSLIQRIEQQYHGLRKSERIVADFLRENADNRLDLSITDLSRTIGVSEATVSRVSRALGYAGFVDMKLSMAAGAPRQYANLPIDFDERDNTLTIGRKLSEALARSLDATHGALDEDAMETALAAILRADKIFFLGVGGGAAVCDEAAHLFIKAGFDAVSYRDGYTQAIVAALDVNEARVFFGISHTGQTRTVSTALAAAREGGAKTIAITSDAASPVAEAAEIVLLTRHKGAEQIPFYGDFLEGRVCQLFIVNTLYLSTLFRCGPEAHEQLEATMQAIRQQQ